MSKKNNIKITGIFILAILIITLLFGIITGFDSKYWVIADSKSSDYNTTETFTQEYTEPIRTYMTWGTIRFPSIPNFGTVIAYADSESNMENPEIQLDSSNGLNYFISKVNTYTTSELPKSDTTAVQFTMFSTKDIGGCPVLYMNKRGYDQQTVKLKQSILSKVYKSLDASDMNNRDKNRIYNWLESIDQVNSTVVREFSASTSTDLYGAQKILMPFQSKIGIVFGVLALVIALSLTFSFVWDIAFLSIPFFTILLTRNNEVSLNNRPFLVSQDAVLAYNEANSQQRQVLSIWLKMRTKSAIIIGLCLTYLISNQIWQLVSFLVDVIGRWIN